MDILGIVDINGWILLIVFLLLAVYLYLKWKFGLWRRLGVPSPNYLPYVGAIREIRKLGLHGLDMKLVKSYGKIVGTYLGGFPSLLIADPDIIKTILVKDFSKTPNRYEFSRTKSELQHGLTVVEDDHWRFIRNTLLPTFSSGKMRRMGPLLRKKYEMLLKVLKKEANEGNTIEFKEVFDRYTMDVIASLGFGMDTESQTNPDNTFLKHAKELFSFKFTPLIFLIMIFPKLDEVLNFFNISPLNNRRLMNFFKSAVHRAIKMRDEGDKNRTDLLQLMLNAHKDTDKNEIEDEHSYEGDPKKWKKRGLTVDEVTGNAILFLLAGFDTTASNMTFMSYCLATNPEIQEKLIEKIDCVLGNELPTYDNVQKVDYLEWVFSETLRFYSPAIRTNRKSEREMDIAGYKIPKDVDLSFAIYAVHRDPEYWPDPDKYDPERFSPENKANRHPYAYLPFGHGPRNCIGQRLAAMEAKCAIVYILQHYRFVTCDETESPLKYLRWKFGLWRRLGVPSPNYLPYVGAMKEITKVGLPDLDVKLVKTYGKVFGLYFGGAPSLTIADPDIIKTVLVKDFSKAPNRYEFSKNKSELQHGLTIVEDDHWRFMRNTLLPTFSSGKMRKMDPLLRKKYESLLQILKKEADEGNTVEFKEVFGRYTMDVIASLGFGMDTDSQTNPDSTFVKYAKELFKFNFNLLMFCIIIFPKLDVVLNYFNISPLNNRKVMNFFKSAVHQAIEMRDEGDKNRKDLLQLMLNAHKDTDKNEIEDEHSYEGDPQKWKKRGLTEDEVTGNSILFLLAGFDTTASTMTFMAYSLATNPEIQEKLIDEVDSILGKELPTYDNVLKVDYLDWVFSETLRFYPPAVRLNRKSKTEIDIGGYKIPKDMDLSFAIYAVHRDPEYWPDPDRFDPER
ncbi:cytochrome P450 3A8-like [Ostrea edulis]|uniref:cytochrome P450 3A8-like n=1 Tax=Ostrea edulis TaxID=37623 RepID=UPI0020951352|nr:cytochrome P450 3A8-like [Ostrea edulis]